MTDLRKNEILTQAVSLKNPDPPIYYEIKKTGYYCVGTTGFTPDGVEYTAVVEFRNAYGELPAAQIAKLPFYGGITIVYAVIAAYVELFIFLGRVADSYLASGSSFMSNIGRIYVGESKIKTFSKRLTNSLSTRAKLHHRDHCFLDCGNGDDLGFLWSVVSICRSTFIDLHRLFKPCGL